VKNRFLRWMGIALAAIVGLGVLAVAAVYAVSWRKITRVHTVNVVVPRSIPTDAAAVARGQHIATALTSCALCHGPDLGGQLVGDAAPLGTIAAPNLTRGEGGLGRTFTDADWVRALRHGVHRDGTSLFLMPSEAFVYMNESDLGDLIAYLKQVPPVDRSMPPVRLSALGRALVAAGQVFMVADQTRVMPYPASVPPGPTAEYGRYLSGFAGCIGCHGDGLSGGRVAGGPPEAPPASNLTPDPTGLAKWTEADFERAIRHGVRIDGTPINVFMPWPIFSKMTDDEVRALWLHLRSVPAKAFGNR
jgi:mono/diheme cytochrome c family protein